MSATSIPTIKTYTAPTMALANFRDYMAGAYTGKTLTFVGTIRVIPGQGGLSNKAPDGFIGVHYSQEDHHLVFDQTFRPGGVIPTGCVITNNGTTKTFDWRLTQHPSPTHRVSHIGSVSSPVKGTMDMWYCHDDHALLVDSASTSF